MFTSNSFNNELKRGLVHLLSFLTLVVVLSYSTKEPLYAFSTSSLPTIPGKIVFVSTRDGNDEIYAILPDGTNETRLTANSASDWWPSLSPDGKFIAFNSNRDGNDEIYIMKADGSSPTRLTNNTAADAEPAWSPDGKRLAFLSTRDGNYEIYVMNIDGTGQTRLTNNTAADTHPDWSPDGTRIAFHSNRDGNFEIYVMNTTGTVQTRLTTTVGDDIFPDWNPIGNKLVFDSGRDGNREIYVMNADGTGQTRITFNQAEDGGPNWSPDGNYISMATNRDGNHEIYIIKANGTTSTQVTHNSATDWAQDWGTNISSTYPIRGNVGDWWADIVLGHHDFSEITPNEVTNSRVFNVGGVTVDRSIRPNRVYVFDGGNSRVLGLSHLGSCQGGNTAGRTCTANSDCGTGLCAIRDGVQADLVLGQPSLSGHSACNGDGNFQYYPLRFPASANTLCNMPEGQNSPLEGGAFGNLAVDSQGNLYVTDWWNHRVLRYNRPFETDTSADYVWGQADFSGQECNEGRGLLKPTASSLCLASPYNEGFVGGVAVDSQGNLWITDNQNCRVLRFPYNPSTGAPDHTANLVFGQADFTTAVCGKGTGQMFAPAAVRVDATGVVYVADSLNNRVSVFVPPLVSGMLPTRQLGANLRNPTGLEIDPNGGIWVVDSGNSQILRFENEQVTKVLLKDMPTYNGACGGNFTCTSSRPCVMCDSRASIGIDVDGNIIVADSDGTQDVWRFPAPLPNPTQGKAHSADIMLFKSAIWGVHNSLGPSGFYSPRGIAIGDGQLIIADSFRLLFYNSLKFLNNGKAVDGCANDIGCFTHVVGSPYGRIKADKNHHLWVVQGGVVQVYSLPLTASAKPFLTIASPLPAQGGGSFDWTTYLNIGGIAVSPSGDQLWLTDPASHKAFRIRQPLTNPVVDVVLGQAVLSGKQCNQGLTTPSATSLCWPGAVALDPQGNVWVADHSLEVNGNHRLLEWDATTFLQNSTVVQFAPPATRVFGTGGSFTITGCNVSSDPLCEPFDPTFDSTGRMVVGMNGYSGQHFPFVYDAPLSNPLPSAMLKDYGSMPYAAVFDEKDNLYLADMNRSRVFVYLRSARSVYSNYLPFVMR